MSMGYGPPQVAFYDMLSGLGDQIQKNAALRQQQDVNAARSQAVSQFSQLDPNSPDYGRQVQTIAGQLHPDDSEGAFKFIGLAHQAQRDAQTDKHQAFSENMATRADKRASAADSRAAYEFEHTPDEFIPNPNAGQPGQPAYIGQGARDPAYIAQVAKAKADAEAAAEAANPSKFSTTPIYGVDDSGKPVIMQAGKNGQLVRSQMPEGVNLTTSTPDSIKTRATRYLDTGDPELINRRTFGAGQQGQAQFDALQNEIEAQRQARGMRPDEISSNKMDYKAATAGASAAARTKAVRETNLDLILRAADAAIPAALEANKALPRTDIVPLNQLIQKGQVMTSNPELLKFGMSNLQLAEHWARAMNPTGVMRESDRDKALSFLSTAQGNGTYEAGVKQLRTQIAREKSAVQGGDTGYDHTRINGGRAIKVSSPEDAAMYPSGTKLILPDGSPGVVP